MNETNTKYEKHKYKSTFLSSPFRLIFRKYEIQYYDFFSYKTQITQIRNTVVRTLIIKTIDFMTSNPNLLQVILIRGRRRDIAFLSEKSSCAGTSDGYQEVRGNQSSRVREKYSEKSGGNQEET